MQPNETGQPDAAKLYRTLMIIWGVMFINIPMFFLLVIFAAPELPQIPGYSNSPLTIVFTVLGTLAVIASIFLRQKLMARAVERQQPESVTSAYVVAFALCETAALFGMLIRFTTNDSFYYLLFIIAVVGLLLNLPRQSDVFNALSGKRI